MESLGKDHAYSDPSLPPSASREEYAVPDVIITRRLRDRELLRKRKAEAQEKDSIQEQEKSKRQKRGRGAGRGRGRQLVTEPKPEPDLEPDPRPEVLEGDKQAPAEPAAPTPACQAPPPVLTSQELLGGTPQGAAEGEPADGSRRPEGEEAVLKPDEAEIPEALNIPLENDHQDNEYYTPVLF
ncbi:hemogen isoform X2 [Dromaius novaehollandiae]|uniref:hemogen isoform X2 n=1 Tax=Dromaius novaehollandiae TaxID=8790 RepID=UPI00311FBB59